MDENPTWLRAGHIVQIAPDCKTNEAFAGCLLVVTETKDWGVQGYVQALGDTRGEAGLRAFIRLPWGEFATTGGTVVWMSK